MPILPIVFIFIAFWPSDTVEVIKLSPDQVRRCSINKDDYDSFFFFDEQDECGYCAVVVHERSMDYQKYCSEREKVRHAKAM